MIYLLFAIAGIMSIITASVINGMGADKKNSKLKKSIVILGSIVIYVIIAIFLLNNKGYN